MRPQLLTSITVSVQAKGKVKITKAIFTHFASASRVPPPWRNPMPSSLCMIVIALTLKKIVVAAVVVIMCLCGLCFVKMTKFAGHIYSLSLEVELSKDPTRLHLRYHADGNGQAGYLSFSDRTFYELAQALVTSMSLAARIWVVPGLRDYDKTKIFEITKCRCENVPGGSWQIALRNRRPPWPPGLLKSIDYTMYGQLTYKHRFFSINRLNIDFRIGA